MLDSDEYLRYQHDRTVLTAIGVRLEPQLSPIAVRLPPALAEAAVAARERDELGEVGTENLRQWHLRHDAAELALIGLVISERGEWDGDEVTVPLRIEQIAAALRAASDHPDEHPPNGVTA